MSKKEKTAVSIDDVDLDILEDTLSFYIRSVNIAVSRDLDEKLKGLEVARGTGKVTILLLADSHPGIRPSLIAQLIMKDKSAMARLIDQMVDHGVIMRQPSRHDTRAQELYVTARGAELARQVRAIATAQSRDFFKDMPAGDKKELLRILRAAYRRIVGFGHD